MLTIKKMCSFRFSENFLSTLDELRHYLGREERSTFTWAGPMTRTRAIQKAVRSTLEKLKGEKVETKKKPARKKSKLAN